MKRPLPGSLLAEKRPPEKHSAEAERPLSMVSSSELASFAMCTGAVARSGVVLWEDVPHEQWFAEW